MIYGRKNVKQWIYIIIVLFYLYRYFQYFCTQDVSVRYEKEMSFYNELQIFD